MDSGDSRADGGDRERRAVSSFMHDGVPRSLPGILCVPCVLDSRDERHERGVDFIFLVLRILLDLFDNVIS